MDMKHKATPEESYIEALSEMDDPCEPDTNMDFATGCKLLTMTKAKEYELLIESISESEDDSLESIMECLRAAYTDESWAFDREIGAMIRERMADYMRAGIVQDKIEYDQRMHDHFIDVEAYQADMESTRIKEEMLIERHEQRLAA